MNYQFVHCVWWIILVFVKQSWSKGTLPVITEHPKDLIASRNNPASLKCSTTGATKVQWFRNGKPAVSSDHDQESHRIILPDGSLFFLRVTSGKRETDAGTYWCVAINGHGAVHSRNATLIVSSLNEKFEVEEKPVVESRAGESVILRCKPPVGIPQPSVRWKHDGHYTLNNSRVYIIGHGDLMFEEVTESDNGKYVCVAENNAGKRESRPITLLVMSAPWFKERPENITSITGSTVELGCKARGSPFPNVTWRKVNGKIPIGRKQILPDHTLQIVDLSSSDSGEYICEASNNAGVTSATAVLQVIAAPELREKPNDVLLLVNRNLLLTCRVEGEPKPLVVWRLPSKDLPMHLIKGQTIGRATVSNDSAILRVSEMQISDMGNYKCWGISNGGGVTSRSNVVIVNTLPPPLIGVRPKDRVVKIGSKVSFPCEVVSEAADHTVTWWHKKAAHLRARQILASSSVTILPIGTLLIREVRADDSGIYTCKVSSDAGDVEAEAILDVTEFRVAMPPHESSMLAPPTKPKILEVSSTSVTLTWLPNSRGHDSKLYKVEYWRAPWQEWRLAREEVKGESYTIPGLLENTAHIFSVRAIDQTGKESFPSPWSDMVYTTESSSILTLEDERKAMRKLNNPTVFLSSANVVGADSVTLSWRLLDSDALVDGVTVYSVTKDSITTVSVLSISSLTYVVRGLLENTEYTFFVVPFFQKIEGAPSNSHTIVTRQSVAPVVPKGLTLGVYKSGTSLIQWRPVSSEDVEIPVIGYKVSISYNNTSTVRETKDSFIETRNLMAGHSYSIKVAYVTTSGMGPWSDSQIFQVPKSEQVDNSSETTEPAIIYAPMHPIGFVYVVLPILLILVGAALLYIRHLKKKSMPSSPEPSGPTLYTEGSLHAPHLINMYGEQKLWRPESDKDSSISSTRLLRPEHMANEYAEPRVRRVSDPTEPYATTALLEPSSPSWKYARCGDNIQVNWGALIPPPPVGPPPADKSQDGTCSSATSSTESRERKGYTSSHYENDAGSEQYEHPCDAASEHTYDIYTPPQFVGRLEGPVPYYVLQTGHDPRDLPKSH